MKKSAILLLVLFGLFGCDDPTVASNIDTFTCSWLPWWMADCSSTAVHDRAIGVLEHGIVQAHARCEVQPNTFTGCNSGWGVKADLFQDNSAISTGFVSTDSNGNTFTSFTIRNDTVETCKKDWSAVDVDGPCVSIHAGTFTLYTGNTTTVCPIANHEYSISMSTNCAGFNLSAF